MQSPDSIIDIKDNDVNSSMFLIDANKYIYTAIDYLYSKQQIPTPITVFEVIPDSHSKSMVEEFGGIEYLTLLTEQRIDIDNIKILCEKLKQAYTKYQLLQICDENKNYLFSSKSEILNPSELIGKFENSIQSLNNEVQQTNQVYKMGDNVDEVLKERENNPNTIPGLETGFTLFDKYTNGGLAGDLTVICARPKTGKSALLTNWAKKFAIEDDLPILYFDTEMNEREQEDRLLSMISGIPHSEIISGMYVLDTEYGNAEKKIAAVKYAKEKLKNSKYFHIYMPTFTLDKITAVAKKFKAQYDIATIFFDYIKFPPSQLGSMNAAEWQILGYVTAGLKDLAGTLRIPIYTACQESRTGDVGGSDRIKQLASKLIFLENKTEEEIMKEGIINGNRKLRIECQRNGKSKVEPINLMYDENIITMKEIN